jgi:hypothetical protein
MIGHPVGLPTKIAGGATVRDNSPPTHFLANVDAYGRNSGSPVFDAAGLRVEGLLVRGNPDFVLNDDCFESFSCADSGCTSTPSLWQGVTRATEFSDLICSVNVSYDVAFGLCDAVVFVTTTEETCWAPQALLPDTEYCWSVTARNACGEATAAWSFRTAPSLLAAEPEACSVDARQPADPDGFVANDWWTAVTLTFDGSTVGALPEDFTAETDPGGVAVAVDEVIPVGDTAEVRFGEVIPAGEWTCLFHRASASEVCLGSLPGDVGGDRLTDEVDVGMLIGCLNDGGCDPWQCDLDRQGICTPADVTRWVDLVTGAGVYDPWQDVSLTACPSGP